jgi:flavin reductase (DIM6/NTAB) family NADH-FMN oxidoreductase RutF
MTPNPKPVDPRALRDAFGCFMTGVTVVTTIDANGTPQGFTANSFSSVSLDPPLLLVSLANSSRNLDSFAKGAGFAVNILAEGQKDLSGTFARPSDDRFANVYWKKGPIGSPVIAGVSAWFDCTLDQSIPAGDHTILIGRIGGFEATPAAGLGYYRGAYVTPAQTAAQIPAGPEVVITAILEAEGKVLLIDDGRGGVTLPMAKAGRDGVQAALARLIAASGLQAQPGAVYSVYDDVAQGAQHIAFLCPTSPGKPRHGAMVDLSREGVADVSDPAARIMLERLADEAPSGRYGIYFGTHEQGRVHRTDERGLP